MARKGGYQILNLRDTAITDDTPTTIKGTYNALARSFRKRIVVSGLNYGGTLYNDYVAEQLNTVTNEQGVSTYTVHGAGFDIEVITGDVVTVTPTQAGGK